MTGKPNDRNKEKSRSSSDCGPPGDPEGTQSLALKDYGGSSFMGAGIMSKGRFLLSALIVATLCTTSLQTHQAHPSSTKQQDRGHKESRHSKQESRSGILRIDAKHTLGLDLPVSSEEEAGQNGLAGGVVGAQVNVLPNQNYQNVLGETIDGVRPSRLSSTHVKVVRVKGQGGTVWNAFQHRSKRFVIPNNGIAKPARVVNPGGVVVDVLSRSARKYEELRSVWATVTYPKGEYLNIDDDIWQKVSVMEITDVDISLPIVYHSGNIICPNKVAFGEAYNRQVIEVSDDSLFSSIFEVLDRSGTEVRGGLYTSIAGYRDVKIASLATKDGSDTFRVCVYCLAHELKSQQLEGIENFEQAAELLKSDNEIKKNFWNQIHTVPQNVYIEASYSQVNFVYVSIGKGTFLLYDSQDLQRLVELHQLGKLQNEWFIKATKQNLLETSSSSTLIVFNDEFYFFNFKVASEYGKSVPKNFEPGFSNYKSNEADPFVTDYQILDIKDYIVANWFEQGQQVPGLFIKASLTIPKRTWPFILSKEDGVVYKYYLNVDAIKQTEKINTKASLLLPLEDEVKEFIQARHTDFSFIVTETGGDIEILSWTQFRFRDKPLIITGTCIQTFKNLNLPNTFIPVKEGDKTKPDPDSKYIRIQNKIFIFNYSELVKQVENDAIQNPVFRPEVRRCFHFSSEDDNPETERKIMFTNDKSFDGKCQGKFVNDSICQGTFEGSFSFCQQGTSGARCNKASFAFICEGTLAREGCRGKFEGKTDINGSVFDQNAKGYTNLVGGRIVGKGEFKSEDGLTKMSFEEDYNINKREGYNFKVSKRDENVINQNGDKETMRLLLECKGLFNVESFECFDSYLKVERCFSEGKEVDPLACDGRFYRQVCQKGGNVDRCSVEDLNNEVMSCEVGVWDGEKCNVDPEVIPTSKNTYFTAAKCKGKSERGVSCSGNFINAQLVTCARDLEGNGAVCPEDQATTRLFNCSGGVINATGCYANYQGYVKVNGTLTFRVESATGAESPELDQFNNKTTLELFDEESQDDEEVDFVKHWVNAKATCSNGFDEKSSNCKGAEFQGSHLDQNSFYLYSLVCTGNLSLSTFECSNGQLTLKTCQTSTDRVGLPFCVGNYSETTCKEGGNLNSCKGVDVLGKRVLCQDAEWDGKICKGKEITFLVNDSAFVNGQCDGLYTENESCEGTLRGQMIVCPTYYLTVGIQCQTPEVHAFKCVGRSDSNGCSGKLTGKFEARGDYINVENSNTGLSTFSRYMTQAPVSLSFWKLAGQEERVELPNRDTQLVGFCKKYLDAESRECADAEVNITTNAGKNVTFARYTCAGVLNLDSLTCTRGMKVISCNGSRIYPQPDVCNGVYIYAECEEGGNATNCINKAENDIETYCDGYFNKGICKPFILPQLPIIQINETYYIKGKCSDKITSNVCKGVFEGKLAYRCNGDPLYVKDDFDACKPYDAEEFGRCQGEMSNDGCKGVFNRKIREDGHVWEISTSPTSQTTVEKIVGHANFKRVLEPEEQVNNRTIVFECMKEFELQTKRCHSAYHADYTLTHSAEINVKSESTVGVCETGFMPLGEYKCEGYGRDGKAFYRYLKCSGKSKKVMTSNGTYSHTCLGNLTEYAECPSGGSRETCRGSESPDRSCLDSFFNGTHCITEMEGENSELVAHQLESYYTTDSDGQDYKIVAFEIDEFTMYGAYADDLLISENGLDKFSFVSATRSENGDISDIIQNADTARLELDEGVMQRIKFVKFQLDELPLRDFAIDDDAKVIKLKLKKMTIKQCFFRNLVTRNSFVKSLSFGSEVYQNYGIDELKFAYSYGEILMRDTIMYLPYLGNRTMNQIAAGVYEGALNVNLPKTEGIYIPSFQLSIKGDSDTIYLEFPEWKIDSRSLDIIKLEDFNLGTNKFSSNQQKADEVRKGYEQKLADMQESTLQK